MKDSHMKTIFLILLFALIGCSEPCNCPTVQNVFIDYQSTVTINYVSDGDTYKFQTGNETVIIRLLGIDCFETRHGTRLNEQADKANISVDSAYQIGLAAKQYTIDNILNQSVIILRDSTQANIDTYGRLLRHVILNDSLYADMLKARNYAVPE